MNYLMCTEFINFIKENGRDILKNPQSFEASLQAYCSTKLTSNVYKSEAFILSEALREGVIQELLEIKVAGDTLIRKLSKQLQVACGFTEYASLGAIDTWCYALGLKEVPVEKVEEARVDESSSRNDKNIYIAKESYFYGIQNFIILFSIWVLNGASGVYINYKSDLSLIGLIGSFLFLVFGASILYFAIKKKTETLKLLKYYLYTIFSLSSIMVIIAILVQLISNAPFSITFLLGSIGILNLLLAYWLFRYFSKSDRIKATFGQYLFLDKFLLVVKNVSFNEYQRLNETKVAPIKSENISTIISDPIIFAKEMKNANYLLIGGVIGLIGGLFIQLLVANSKSGNKAIGISPIILGAILLIRGIIKIQQIKSNNNVQPEKTNTQSSTNTNYSQRADSTNTYSSANTNYTEQSENVKSQDSDADYFKKTSNQSTKKEEPKKEKTFEDRLEELKRLHEKGIITEAEFQTRKTEILKEL